jgi:hypothetical protein
MVGGDTTPILLASSSNWRLDIKAGRNANSPGSIRFRLGDEPDSIDVLARKIQLHSLDSHHFAVAWNHKGTNPGSGTLKLFYDSRKVASLSIPHSKIAKTSPKPFQIGEASNSKRVALDELRFSKGALHVQGLLTGHIKPGTLYQTKFKKTGPTATKNGETLGEMTLFGNKGMVLKGLAGRQKLIVNQTSGRADIFTTKPISVAEITKKSYRFAWKIGATGIPSSPKINKPTHGHHLTLRDGQGLISQLGDGTLGSYVDFKGVSLQFINNTFKLLADTGSADQASILLTSGIYSATSKNFHSGFTATLEVDGNGWNLKIDQLDFDNGKQPAWKGSWSEKDLSPADLFTGNMHLGAGCTAAKDQAKISLHTLSAELVQIR